MTLMEAALVARLVGRLSPANLSAATGRPDLWEPLDGVYDCLTRAFNGHYDNGVEEVLPRFKLNMSAEE